MYQALYRKYRPNTFEEVVGQKIVVQTLINAIENQKLSHAYLFSGPRGTGKTSIAKILAKTINCKNLKGAVPCNKCVNCTQFNQKQMIDIIEIDAASNNGVDEIRELKSKVNLVPNSGKYKIYIIDEVHMLTVGAFNALLKTLEEPPSHIVFVLATTEPQKIPATIISRCQRFDFKKIPEHLIYERLKLISEKEQIKITEKALLELSRLADGGMRDALSMLDQVSAFSTQEITEKEVHKVNGTLPQENIKNLIIYLLKNDITNVLKEIDEYDNQGKNFLKLIEEIVLFLKNILLYRNAKEYFKEKNNNYKIYDFDVDDNLIIQWIEELMKTLNIMKNYQNQKIIIETVMIKLISKTNNLNKSIQNNQLQKQNKDIFIKEQQELIKNKQQKNENIIKEQIETEILVQVNSDIKNKLKEVKKIRINNALSKFNKKEMLNIKNKLNEVQTLVLSPEYNYEASLVLDGKLKAYGNDYLVFVYDTEHFSDLFNENILKIEQMFEKIFHKKYKLISTYLSDWEKIKNEFNKKIKKYEFIEDKIDLNKIFNLNKNQNNIDQLFDDIVEYKEEERI